MVEIFCTGPLTKRFCLRPADFEDFSGTNTLGAWYSTVLNVGPLRLVVWLNGATNLMVVTRARQSDFPAQFPAALEELLVRIELPSSLAAKERQACSEFRFVRARDRSLLGSLRDAVVRVRWGLEDGRDLKTLENDMAEMPARAKAFFFPREVLFSRFGLPKPRPLRTFDFEDEG